MPLPCTQVSKVLVHVWIGTSVVMGIVWICGDATLEVTDKCTGCDPSTAGSSGCSCTTMKGLGGFTTDGAYDASLSDNPYHYFNWHPLLMTVGFVLCYMEGAIAYRALPFAGNLFEGTFLEGGTKKWIHGVLMFVATACSIAGTVCIFKFHNATDGLTLYSLHSVLGLGTVILFTFQFVMGLWFFALQKNGAVRGYFIAAHRMLGTMLGGFTAAAIITGILDEQRTMWEFGRYQGMPATDVKAYAIMFSNWWCVAIVLAGMTVYHILYDQTDKVKTVLTNQGLLPKNPTELSRESSRDYTQRLAEARMDDYRRIQEATLNKSL